MTKFTQNSFILHFTIMKTSKFIKRRHNKTKEDEKKLHKNLILLIKFYFRKHRDKNNNSHKRRWWWWKIKINDVTHFCLLFNVHNQFIIKDIYVIYSCDSSLFCNEHSWEAHEGMFGSCMRIFCFFFWLAYLILKSQFRVKNFVVMWVISGIKKKRGFFFT